MKHQVECVYAYCNKVTPRPVGTLKLYCCKKHRYLARGSKRGKRLAKKL